MKSKFLFVLSALLFSSILGVALGTAVESSAVALGVTSLSLGVSALSYFKPMSFFAYNTTGVLWNGEDGAFKTISFEEVKKLNDADYDQYMESLDKHRLETIEGLKEGKASKEDLEKLNKEISTLKDNYLTSILKAQKEQGEILSQLHIEHKVTGERKTVKDLLLENADKIKAIKNHPLEILVKASQAPADIGDRSDLAQRIPGVEQLVRRRPFVKDWFRVVPTDTEYIRKTEQDVVVRDAKNVAACAASTHNTKLTWKQTTLQQKKVRDFVHVCIDMMEDYDFVEGEINDLISYGVQIKVDNGLLLDDGTGANINGIASYASTFSAALAGADYSAATGTPIQAPNVGDLICVAGAQIEFLGQENKFMPNVAFLNPKQIKLLKLTKDVNEQYLLPNWLTANGDEVGMIRLVGNPLVPENEAYVMDSTMGVIYQRKATEVSMSFENNDNFETETVTIKGIERLNLWVSTNNSNAFMHIPDIAAAITAITKP